MTIYAIMGSLLVKSRKLNQDTKVIYKSKLLDKLKLHFSALTLKYTFPFLKK